ncbi:CDP-alcohol phosphatidyltransferase family protein [Erythrobacter tepidarius]|uniref:CDP-alcohol phosphatidyltransferase family protein n=1 Tax=Erythrobacter tepidarius TaxID=60454 RepID=UPI000A3ABE93|nr:CDP-alcohol phosphatidyltransferase family protein [Erythrobacter tepidarius]
MTSPLAFRFASAAHADRLVAGLPAAARLARAVRSVAADAPLVLVLPGGSALAPRTMAEIARLAPGIAVELRTGAEGLVVPGETLPDAAALAAILAGAAPVPAASADPAAALDAAGRAILRGTAKPGDGIVARAINRPLSRAVSGLLLQLGWVRPGHATMLTALTALAMLACLLAFPTPAGLAAGAALFQLASVIDGVDGEIARATLRSSKAGASLDSLVDALTNLAFLAGAGISFALQGGQAAALFAAGACAVQALGLALLGRAAWQREGVLHFDTAKRVRQGQQAQRRSLIDAIAARDFYCFAFMLAALAGVLDIALGVFLAASLVWLAEVIRTLR